MTVTIFLLCQISQVVCQKAPWRNNVKSETSFAGVNIVFEQCRFTELIEYAILFTLTKEVIVFTNV